MATTFGILGELQVLEDGVSRDLGPMRQRSLLARLLLRADLLRADQPIGTERLIEELWPDEPPDVARHRLHVHVSRLRSVLGGGRTRLTNDAAGYRLRVEPELLDASRFEGLAADGRRALAAREPAAADLHLREALALWRGPALVEFADEPFARSEATRLDQLRLGALEDRIDAQLALGLHHQLIEELRSLTLEQPYRESFWAQFMLALYRAGRQADALHAYGEARMRLADELGIEPGPALQSMEQRVLAHDPTLDVEAPSASSGPAAPVMPPSNLPLQRTTFIGRERDLAVASELLAESRLLTLTGAPGVGKTRMALRLATDQGHRYPDGSFFVSLASVVESRRLEPVITAALATANAFGDQSSGGVAVGRRGLHERLAGLRLLLVLDNLEQVAGAAGPIDRILEGAPRLTILATSRAPLGVPGEQEFLVLPLDVPPVGLPADTEAIAAYDAVALLVARARSVDPRFAITPQNAAAIAGIADRLDGLPLAIELGAGRLRAFSPQGLLDRLERRLPLLTSGTSGTISRHRTLRGAIAWSYELLTADEQRFFRCLAPFVTSFTATAAAEVADLSLEETWANIESLIAQGLLYRPVDVGDARIAMLQTLREYAAEQLEQKGDPGATFARHAGYFIRLAERCEVGPSGDRANEAISSVLPELEEIGAALRRCATGGDRELGLRLAARTWRAWQAAGRITEGREWLARLLDPPGLDAGVRADALVALAGLDYWQADFSAAMEAYEEALGLYRAAGDRSGEAEVLSGMAMTATWNGDPSEGARLAAEARVLFESLGDRSRVGETFMAEGFALFQDREYAAARPLWEAALAISRELGADALAVTQLAAVACIEFQAGATENATAIILDCLAQACDLDNVGLCVWMLDFVAAFTVEDRPALAVRVAGAADALRTAAGGGMPIEDLHVEPARVAAKRLLGAAELEQAWAEGRRLSLQEAIAAAHSLRHESVS
jgi:predicted ATPase/DNA-binding SARP family transcriptional activator